MQPVTNLRTLKVAPLGVDRAVWSKDLIKDGQTAHETIIPAFAGKSSVGDQIAIAGLILILAACGAEKVGVGMRLYPVTSGIVRNLEEMDAVKLRHYITQGDTPKALRADCK